MVGTHGLVAVAWDPQFREYAARGVLYRFYPSRRREMTERDYGNWLAAAIFGEACHARRRSRRGRCQAYLLSDQFSVAAYKGEGLTFRAWDHQLRQPLLLFGPRMLVSMAPQPDPHTRNSRPMHWVSTSARFECHMVRINRRQSEATVMHAKVLPMRSRILLLASPRLEAGMLFISDERDNTVTVLDSATLKPSSSRSLSAAGRAGS